MTIFNSPKSRLLIVFGVFALTIIALILPTPLHDWFVSGSIGGVPADVVVMSLIILITPVTIISTIVTKFNVDFADEVPVDAPRSDVVVHTPM